MLSVSEMRFELLVLFLFVGVICAAGEGERGEEWNDDSEPKDKEEGRGREDRKRDDRDWNDKDRDEDDRRDRDYDGNRRDRDLYYPCHFEDDMDCVRHYFANSGQCKEVYNYNNKPVYREQQVAYLPGFNLTVLYYKQRIKYVRDRISRFYINKKTDNLVMTVDFEAINVETRDTTFVYQRRGQEPIKLTDYSNGTYPVTLTAVIPLKKGIDFKESRVTAYFSRLPENIQIGPKILSNTDPVVVRVNAAIFANLQMAGLEYFLTEAPGLFFGYLQKYICNFGIPISYIIN